MNVLMQLMPPYKHLDKIMNIMKKTCLHDFIFSFLTVVEFKVGWNFPDIGNSHRYQRNTD